MEFVLNIDILIVLICEYLGWDCKEYLNFIDCINKFEYLFTVYNETSNIDPLRVRYLNIFDDATFLYKFSNVIEITFNNKVVGLDKKLAFTISFDTLDITQKSGKIWDINIPDWQNK